MSLHLASQVFRTNLIMWMHEIGEYFSVYPRLVSINRVCNDSGN